MAVDKCQVQPAGELREEFHSQTCPQCSSLKRDGNSFCRGCYFALPAELQHDLYKLLGQGYAEAVAAAKAFLKGLS